MVNDIYQEVGITLHKDIIISMRIRRAGSVNCLHTSHGVILELNYTLPKFGMYIDQRLEKIVCLPIGSSVVVFQTDWKEAPG